MTRNGKIARLPGHIRAALNQRLDNGEEGPALLRWLNRQPDVQESIRDDFGGASITEQNLSEWRLGGFREWQLRRELIEHARHLWEGNGEIEEAVDTYRLSGALAKVLAARYAELVNNWDGEPDPKFEEKLRLLRGLNRDFALLQKTMHQAELHETEYEQAGEEREKRRSEAGKERATAPFWAKMESEAIAATLGGGEGVAAATPKFQISLARHISTKCN